MVKTKYVDGFLIAVPEAKKEQYLEEAKISAQVFKDHGAIRVMECWGDNTPDGTLTSFPMAVKLEEGEVVCFSWIEYPDKETRDACEKSSINDPRFAAMDMAKMAFDGKRLVFGGFVPILEV